MDKKELATSFKLYKESLGDVRPKIKQEKKASAEKGQFRVFYWQPWEYILVLESDEEKVKAIPFTVFCDLTTCNIRMEIKGKIYAPLPFIVQISREVVESESVPIWTIKEENIEKITKHVEKSVKWSANWHKREFLKLVKKRYEKLESDQETKVVKFKASVFQKYQDKLQPFKLAAKESGSLRGKNWFGVVEGDKVVIYLPKEFEDKNIRLKLFEDVVYEGIAKEKLILEGLPDYPSHSYLEENLYVEVLED